MGVIRFYHMTRAPVEATLARLLERAHDAGLRVEVRGTDLARMDWLDQKLWLGDEAGFLPHGLAGGPHDALQPILLTTGDVTASVSPQDQYLHQSSALDTLGVDRPETECKF